MSGQIQLRVVRKFDVDRFIKALMAHLRTSGEQEQGEAAPSKDAESGLESEGGGDD